MGKSNKFRNDSGTRYTKALFYETTLADKSTVVYTLKDDDHEGFPSLYQLYMQCGDLTEYEFAKNYLDGWEHWEILTKCVWFAPYVERWRKELFLLVSAKALRNVQRIANDREATGSMAANKYLLEKGWAKASDNKVGRPSKDAIKRKALEMMTDENLISDDYARMNKEVH